MRQQISQSSASSTPPQRKSNYQPSSWDDREIQSLTATFFLKDEHLQQWKELKEDVRRLITEEKRPVDQLKLVDCVQQIGLGYHFEEEIKQALFSIYSCLEKLSLEFKDNVYAMTLCFRLLREHGFDISNDLVVRSYRDDKGSFRPDLSNDITGLLSLYEASFLAVEGEDELEAAKFFATKHLLDHIKIARGSLNTSDLAQHVERAMDLPLHLRMPRFHAKLFIEHAHATERFIDQKLLEFADFDFSIAQSIYQKELKEMMRWRTSLSLAGEKLGFARDWPVESYFLAACLVFEPQFSKNRKELAKVIYFIHIIDDIYDIYGSLEELELFTVAVERREVSAIRSLPEFMTKSLRGLLSIEDELACTVMAEKGLDIRPYLKSAWSDLCKAYMLEARWYHTGYIPSLKEYMDNAWISVAAPLTLVLAHCLSDNLTDSSLESFDFYSDIIRHSSMIVRLYNDLGTSKGELRRGDVMKSVQCYMNEKNVSEKVAREHIKGMAWRHWKELNRETVNGLHKFEESFKRAVMRLPRLAHLFYQQEDDKEGELDLGMIKDSISSLLIAPLVSKPEEYVRVGVKMALPPVAPN